MELEFCLRWGSQKSEPKIGIHNHDGKKHKVANKKRCDRVMRCSSDDRVEAKQGLHEFLHVFNLKSKSVEEIADLGFYQKSLKAFQSMTFIEPGESLPSEYINDFLITVCSHSVVHEQFSVLPSKSMSDCRPIHTFLDSLRMTRGSDLKYCNKCIERNYITSFPLDRIYYHSNGTVLLNNYGILIDAKC
jgi:hypothetical protein